VYNTIENDVCVSSASFLHIRSAGIIADGIGLLDLDEVGIDLEIIRERSTVEPIRSVLFDFDGTISVIREGWQEVMVPYFAEELSLASKDESIEEIMSVVREFVDLLTGKDTIFQCIRLGEEIEKRGGRAKDPLEYKREYLRRLSNRIEDRIDGLREGRIKPEDMVIMGSFELLEVLAQRDVRMYLASGTDHPDVLEEARLLGLERYFGDRIFGALDDWTVRSKATVIDHILKSHGLGGGSLAVFGDGFVEIECGRAVGGVAVGVASNEVERRGLNEWKRSRLIAAGADVIVPDYLDLDPLIRFLFE